MKQLLTCRRTFLAFFSICVLTAMAFILKTNVSGDIVMIISIVAGANATQRILSKPTAAPHKEKDEEDSK